MVGENARRLTTSCWWGCHYLRVMPVIDGHIVPSNCLLGSVRLIYADNKLSLFLGCALFTFGISWWWRYRHRRGGGHDLLRTGANDHNGMAVLITGCDSGIGFETALLLDHLGFTVFAGCLLPTGSGANRLKYLSSSRLYIVSVDVTDQLKVDVAVELIKKKIKELHLIGLWSLVNNAGVYIIGQLDWFTWPQCQHIVDVNLLGTIRVTRAALPLLKETKGRIVNITSFAGRIALPYRSIYSACEFGLEGFSDSLRLELRPYGVHVAVVALGNHARLTNICGNQPAFANAMWLSMSAEKRLACQRTFWRLQVQTDMMTHAGRTSFEETSVLQDIVHAIISTRPNRRYTSGSWWDILVFQVVSRLPSQVQDMLLSTQIL